MTEDILPPDILDMLKPEYVAPLVLYLCHQDTSKTGGLFEVGGGWAGELRRERAKGAVYAKKGEEITVEGVQANFDGITDFDEPTYPTSSMESTMEMVDAIVSAE
mgnify:CR=1 FL=1